MTAESAEMQTNIRLGWDMGDKMVEYFSLVDLPEELKADQSLVTAADIAISDSVVHFFGVRGRRVVSEERGRTAEYGDPDAEYLDPIDFTNNFKNARLLGKQSIAAFSLGSAVGGNIVRGVINLPLMDRPRLYWAEDGVGAFRVRGRGGQPEQLEVMQRSKGGVILVSENHHPYISRLQRMGFRTVPLGGAVFKASCVPDQGLLTDFEPNILARGEWVAGFVSDSAQAHDYAAAKKIAEEAGMLACGIEGGELLLTKGKHGCIFACTELARDSMIEALNPA